MTPDQTPWTELYPIYNGDSRWQGEAQNFFALPRRRRRHPRIPGVQYFDFNHPSTEENLTKKFNRLGAPSGWYIPAGAVSFPEHYDALGVQGFALLLGFHCETRKVYILSERAFTIVYPGVEGIDQYPQDGMRPLDRWLHYAQMITVPLFFTYQESDQAANRYLPGVRRAFPDPKTRPRFLAFPWGDWKTAMITVQEWHAMGRVVGPTRQVYREMRDYDADPAYEGPALHSLCYGLGQLDRLLQTDKAIQELIRTAREVEQARTMSEDPLSQFYRKA